MNTTLSPRDPFRIMPLSRWFDDFPDNLSSRGLKIKDTDKDIIIEAIVAGVPAKDVLVNIEDGVLTIKAEADNADSAYRYYYSAALSGGQWEKADAEIENGVVVVTVPKTEAVKPRTISVREKKNS